MTTPQNAALAEAIEEAAKLLHGGLDSLVNDEVEDLLKRFYPEIVNRGVSDDAAYTAYMDASAALYDRLLKSLVKSIDIL